ncbi:hypothetical protein KHU12_25985, partial [Pseudocitrobacter faecalis]
AARHLDALLSSEHQVVGVFTQPDRPAGRGKKLMPSPVKVLAEVGPQGLLHTLAQLAAGTAKPEVQDEALVTYAEKLSKEEARVD